MLFRRREVGGRPRAAFEPSGRRLERGTVVLAGSALAALVAAATVATGLVAIALVTLGSGAALIAITVVGRTSSGEAGGARFRHLLLYAYCFAVPLNDALPPGPAGTVARVAGVAFFVLYILVEPESLKPKVISLAGWVFVGLAFASALWAIRPDAALRNWISVVQLFAIAVLIANIVAKEPRVARGALWSYAASATLTALVAVPAYFQGQVRFGRAIAFEEQNPASFAALVLPAAIFLFGEVQAPDRRRVTRLLAAGALIVCVAAIALSGTRAAWVGAAVGVAVWLVLRRDWRQILAVGAASAGVVVLLVLAPEVQAFLAERLGSSLESGGSGRTDIWAVGLSIFASDPLLGVGFGNFPTAFTPYAISQASGAWSTGALYPGRDPHNLLLGVLVETGIVGAVLFAIFLAAAVGGPSGGRIADVVRIALISLFVQSLFMDIMQRKQLWLFLALAFGLAAAQRLKVDAGVALRASRSSPLRGQSVPTSSRLPPSRPGVGTGRVKPALSTSDGP